MYGMDMSWQLSPTFVVTSIPDISFEVQLPSLSISFSFIELVLFLLEFLLLGLELFLLSFDIMNLPIEVVNSGIKHIALLFISCHLLSERIKFVLEITELHRKNDYGA